MQANYGIIKGKRDPYKLHYNTANAKQGIMKIKDDLKQLK